MTHDDHAVQIERVMATRRN